MASDEYEHQTEAAEPAAEGEAMQEDQSSYWAVIRDLLGFQFKLLLDAGRDFLLSPVSIVSVIMGMARDRDDPGYYFRQLMDVGRRSDRWINLFDEHDTRDQSADAVVRQFEDVVRREYAKGGLVHKFKHSTDDLVELLHELDERAEKKSQSDS